MFPIVIENVSGW